MGYNSVKQVKGGQMNLLCVSWATIGNKDGKATLNDVMDTKKLTSYSADGETAGDYIDTWDLATANWGKTYYYVDQAEAWGAEYADTWVDGDLAPVETTAIGIGSGFWYNAKGNATLTFANPVK